MSYASGQFAPQSLTAKLWHVNWPVLIVAGLIAAIGCAALYSVAGGSFQPWAERHALRFLVAVAIVLVMAMVRTEVWLHAAYPAYTVALVALALVPVLGTEALGARRWLSFWGVTFQPAELMKLALVAALARYYQWLPVQRVSHPLWAAIPIAMIAVPVALTLRQPDLGTATLFGVTGLSLMFLSGVSLMYFLAGAAGAVAAAPVIWSHLHDYQRRRIETFLNPDLDPLGAGYHIAQSKIAIGSGGLSGKGFLLGTQSQLDFVPEKHTDFIVTILGEEWGFIGLAVLLALFALLIALIIVMAWRCQNRFGRLVIAGSAVTLFVYVFINVAMVTGLVPVVGVPLPLVSHGGTSMMTLMIGLGLAMSAHVHGGEGIRRKDVGRFW
ncbi:MAG TPA: rod shape-determining protein RodA [Hyphomicrobium sp.]|nr:rod shape-determining protein RodA [Hyphomicrobium sp.]